MRGCFGGAGHRCPEGTLLLSAQWNQAVRFLHSCLLLKPWVFQPQQALSRNAHEKRWQYWFLVWFFFFFFFFLLILCVSVLFAGRFVVHPFPPARTCRRAPWQKGSLISVFFPTWRRGSEHRQGGISHLSNISSTFGDACRALQGGGGRRETLQQCRGR